MKHISIDIETLGTAPGSAILSIGACRFDERSGDFTDTVYRVIDLGSCLAAGLTVSASTIRWWMQQPDAARAVFNHPRAFDIWMVADDFAAWVQEGDAFVWGHGATFDISLLEAVYAKLGAPVPWKFYDVRDTRTLFDLTGVTVDRAEGVHHNALDDAVAQARAIWTGLRILRGDK